MKKIASTIVLLATAFSVQAAPITYNVNREIGTGSVVGSVTTDGTIGIIARGAVTSWSLTIDEGDDGPFQITDANSALLLDGTLLSADSTGMYFNFAGSSGFALFQNPGAGSGINWWCLEGVTSFCAGLAAGETVNRLGTASYQFYNQLVEIASVEAPNDVPEPISLAIFGLGLTGLAATRRRRK